MTHPAPPQNCPFCARAARPNGSWCEGCGATYGRLDENRDRDLMLTLALGPLMALGLGVFGYLLLFRVSRLGLFETILVGIGALTCLATLIILAKHRLGREKDQRVWRKDGEIRIAAAGGEGAP